MTNRIQLRRDTTDNWTRVNPILEDGEPGLDIDTNQIKYGDGSTVWNDLSYASTGSGIINGSYSVSIDQNGTVTMETSRGNLEFGALPEPGGPSHFHIMRASGDNADLYFGDDFNYMLQRGPANAGNPAYGVEIGTNGMSGDQQKWRFETDGILTMPPGNETTSGWIQWSHASDDLTNVAGAGFVDYRNIYTGLGLTAPRDTNAQKGIWFGTPLDQTVPFLPGTSMLFKDDTLYIPKNGYIKSHDIAANNWPPTLTTRNTTVTIQTNSEYNITQIQNPGSGYGSQSNVTTSGGSGSNMTVNIDVLDGFVRAVEVNQPGTGYNNGDTITIAGGNGTAAFTIDNYSSTQVNGTYDWLFGADGTLTLPTVAGDEGSEIDFTKAPNSTLSGSAVIVDQYIDKLRFFEGGGTSRGAYIDLKQAAAGVGTLLNNRVSGFVDAGAFVTMDLLKATVTTTSNRGLSLAATTGSFVIYIAGTYAKTSTTGGAMAEVTLTTTPEASMFDWDFSNAGDSSTYIITDTTNNRSYRITLQIGYLYNNNMISIERLI